MYRDTWGNVYESLEEAENGIREICKKDENFWQTFSEDMCIPLEVMNWIHEDEKRFKDFQREFSTDIAITLDSLCEFYMEELEVSTWVKIF